MTLPDDHAIWGQLSDLIAQRMGLHFREARWGDLRRGVAAAAQGRGWCSSESYARALLASPPGRDELQHLARHLTIGETYFFRDPHLLKALTQKVLPAIIATARRAGQRRLRLWSAGCATGEEAYTLAILLQELLPDFAQWQVTINATDLNPGALHKAEAGIYGEWSFRATPPALRARYFERQPDGRYRLDARIRRLVDFSLLNLVEDAYPSLTTQTNAMDLVFCRNVLMYFTQSQAQGAVARLRQSLVEGGWLVVSPSETSQRLFASFQPVNFPGAVLYRKPGAVDPGTGRPPAPLRSPSVTASLETCSHVSTASTLARPRPLALPAPCASSPPAPSGAQTSVGHDAYTFALLARAEADQGRLDQALAWCKRWIAVDKLDPTAHYLSAMVLMEQGQLESARLALQRATFLSPNLVVAHFALGNLARRRGRTDEAYRHLSNAHRLLAPCASADLLANGDGLTAGRLRQILTAMLDSGEEA